MSSTYVVNKGTGLQKCVDIHEMGTTVQADSALIKIKKRLHRTTFSRQVQFLKKKMDQEHFKVKCLVKEPSSR